MQSKQKNAQGKRKNKSKPTPKAKTRGTKRAGPRAGAKPRGRSTQVRSQPLNTAVIQRNFFGMRFGSAAPHDEFNEGGLRITGKLPTGFANLTQDVANLGLVSSAGISCALVNPSGAIVSGSSGRLFDSAGPLADFSQFFRRFRFRKLSLEVTSRIPPSVTTAATGAGLVVQVSQENDPFTGATYGATGWTQDASVQGANCTRFPAWTPEMMCPLISEKGSSKSDELWYMPQTADSITVDAPTLRGCCQGAAIITGNFVNPTADLTVGTVLVHFVVDLYGFTNLAIAPLPMAARRELRASKLDQGDRKSSVPDADLGELIDLTPKGARLRVLSDLVPAPLVRTDPPQSARVSSKK
jgi:hypothetical protein